MTEPPTNQFAMKICDTCGKPHPPTEWELANIATLIANKTEFHCCGDKKTGPVESLFTLSPPLETER